MMQVSFKVGDNVVCPSYGVGEVTAIEQKAIGGNVKPFYIIKILDSNMKFMLPADGTSTAGVRSLVDSREVREIYKILKTSREPDKEEKRRWTKRCRRYTDMLRSGSAQQVAEVLRDLLSMSGRKELSFAERKILESARGMLVKELALASEKSEIEVNRRIDRIFFPKRASS
jgi:CarD family transcriptional regulator